MNTCSSAGGLDKQTQRFGSYSLMNCFALTYRTGKLHKTGIPFEGRAWLNPYSNHRQL